MIIKLKASVPEAILADFGRRLEAHIRREERIVFPLFETEIQAGRLTLDGKTIKCRRNEYRG